ncbi:MAG TPA: energy transducer TonB [Thermoanaerobaculia bacterium]|jgi:TonB family protein|nr:energy transducer TonB [Thermoanaerobaculia bacterium]
MNINVLLLSLPSLVIALALSSGPARADSPPATVAQELERARSLASHGDQQNACRAYSRANELAEGKSSPSLIGVANCYKEAKDGAKAVATARQALAVAATPEERTQATITLGSALLGQADEKAWTEAADLFKEQAASSSETLSGSWLLSALLALHRDQEAVEFLRSLRKQGKSTEDIQQMLCIVNVGDGSKDAWQDPRQIDDRNVRVRKLDPDAPMRIGGKVGRPEIRHRTDPEMTAESRRHPGHHGTVIMEAVIDAQGQVRSTRILAGQPYGLTQCAVAAVKTWTFKPVTLDSEPVPVCYVLTISFNVT